MLNLRTIRPQLDPELENGEKIKSQLTGLLLDGASFGVHLKDMKGLKTEISKETYDYLLVVFSDKKFQPISGHNIISIKVKLTGTLAKLSVNYWHGKYYLNIEGNPISFITGQNILGSTDLPAVLSEFYESCALAIKKVYPTFTMPKDVMQALDKMHIYLNSLAFSCYSKKLNCKSWPNMVKLFNLIDHCYAYSMQDLHINSVKDELGVRVSREGDYSIRFDRVIQGHRYWSLAIYNKFKEQDDKGKFCPKFLQDRVRFDLTLHNYWFNRNKLKMFNDLQRRTNGDYCMWVETLIQKILSEIKLSYILKFKIETPSYYGKYQNDFIAWTEGKKISPMAKSCLLTYGIDTDLSYEFHVLVAIARSSFGIEHTTAKKAMLGDTVELNNLAKQFINGLTNPQLSPLLKAMQNLTVDSTLSTYRLYRPNNDESFYVDTTTGKLLV